MTRASTTRIIGWPRLAAVWLTLTFESLTEAFWRPLTILVAAVGLFLLNVPAGLPYWMHWGLLAVVVIAFAVTFGIGCRRLQVGRYPDLLRRLEEVNKLEHRPLRSLEDSLTLHVRDRQAAELWHLHQQKLRRSLGRLKVGAPRGVLARRDPFALRFLAVLLLAVGLTVAGGDWSGRLLAGMTPALGSGAEKIRVVVDAWVNPPEYTRMVPMVLDNAGRKQKKAVETGGKVDDADGASELARRQEERIAAPVGSRLTIRVNNANSPPVLMAPDGGEMELKEDTAGYYGLETTLTHAGPHQVLVDGDPIADWNFALIPDQPPEVAFKGAPSESQRHSLLIPYQAQDDYGIEGLALHMQLAGANAASAADRIEVFPVPIAARGRNTLDSQHYFDLTPHPWAGLRVKAWLQVRDAIGQAAESKPVVLVLPQRIFNHPVARAIIRERRKLAANGSAARFDVVRNLHGIAWHQEAYDNNILVFLALSVVRERLQYREVEPQMASVMKILWDTALRIEDGEVSLAAQEMQAIQKELMDAMARGASQQELARLMDELEKAMAKYMDALQEQARQQRQKGEELPKQELSEMMSGQSIQDMMNRIRDLMRMGMMEEAQQLLSQLQQMMQNLQVVEQQMPQDGQEALEMLRDLQQMMGEQQDIMERAHERAMGRESQQQQGGADSNRRNGEMSDSMSQDELRQRLKELSQRYGDMMGETPGAFGDADGAMQDAAESLAQGRNHRAVQSQGNALESMQEASQAMQESIIERFMGQGNMQQPVQGMSAGDGRDPFGRMPNPGSRGSGRGDHDVPTQGDVDRARRIQEELRRRSGEQDRPPVELDYIERLLNPF